VHGYVIGVRVNGCVLPERFAGNHFHPHIFAGVSATGKARDRRDLS
jgi:hypothetical protein